MTEISSIRKKINTIPIEVPMPDLAGSSGHPHKSGYPRQLDYTSFQNLPVAVYSCDEKGYIRSFNRAAAELWGREPEIGKDLWCGSWKIYSPDGSPVPLDSCPMALALKEGHLLTDVEIVIERPDGTRRNIRPYPQSVFDESGKLIGATNTLIDITEHKIAEKKILTLAAIVHSSDDAIISKDLNGIVTSWNEAAERIFGYTDREMIGQSIVKLIPDDRLDEEPQILDRLKKGERVDHFETKRVTKDHRIVDISLCISPIKNSNGIIIGASKIARDISGEKRSETLIRETETRFRMAVESTNLGTWEFYPLTGQLIWSAECRKIYAVGENVKIDYDFYSSHIHPDDADSVQKEIAKTMESNSTGSYDMQYRIVRHSDGQPRWVRVQGKVYFTDDNKAERLIGTVLDITDETMTKVKLEALISERTNELRQLNEQLERSNRELEQYAYIASHDLQEPLRKIQTFSELLKKNIHDEAAVERYFDKINYAAKRMSELINDVLNYSRLYDYGNRFVDTDLNVILSEVKSDFDLLIEQKEAEIYAGELPHVKGNPLQLQQLFTNLISNSLKFCERRPEIRISSHAISSDKLKENPKLDAGCNYIELNFEDNGIGFEPEHADQIFVIFQRLNNRSAYSGTGIGLALCKKIVENHHGLITATAEKGKGATFTVLLPAV